MDIGWAPRALLGLLVPVALVAAAGGPPTADASLFAAAGEQLLSPRGAQVLADPALQVGPLYLLVVGLGSRLAGLAGAPVETGAALLAAWTVAAVLLMLERGTEPAAARWGLHVHVLLGGPLAVALVAGHVEDLLAVLLVALAGVALHRNAPVLAGLSVGAAACTKLWALLALAALLCAPSAGRWRALTVACGAVVVVHLPFLPAARTHALRWSVEEPSLLASLVPAGTPVTSLGRLLQLAVGLLLVAGLLRRSQWDARLRWTVPAAVVLARLVTDPHVLPYYWGVTSVPLALLVWSGGHPLARAAAAGAASVPLLLVLTSVGGRAGTVLLGLVAVLTGPALHRAARRPTPQWLGDPRPVVV